MWYIIIAIILYLVWRKLTKIEINPQDAMFTSSFLRGSSLTSKERIIIDEKYVTWRKNRGLDFLWLSVNSVTIPRNKISGVIIIDKFLGSDIIITTEGYNLRANFFKKKDANEIKLLLTP